MIKKLLLLLGCFLAFTLNTKAYTVVEEDLPYYYKINQSGEVKQLKKYHILENDNIVFSKSYLSQDILSDLDISTSYDEEFSKLTNKVSRIMADAIYFGYNLKPTDKNYYLTQFYIWNYIFNQDISLCDREGNELSKQEKAEYTSFSRYITSHNDKENFFDGEETIEIWSPVQYGYYYRKISFAFEVPEGLSMESASYGFQIIGEKVGEYKVDFIGDFDSDVKWYMKDGKALFGENLKGPSDISHYINFKIYGTPFKIMETFDSVNGKYGDAEITGMYNIYLKEYDNTDLKLTIPANKDEYVKSNSKYLIEDSHPLKGIKDLNIKEFQVKKESEYVLNINREIVKANVYFHNVMGNYNIYLKSNNELYDQITEDKIIVLPYGTYYIVNEDQTDYQEFIVNSEEDVIINLEKIRGSVAAPVESEIVEPSQPVGGDSEEKHEEKQEYTSESLPDNPLTLDNSYLLVHVLNLLALLCTFIRVKEM